MTLHATRTRPAAFTLVELLVVIAIVSILSLIGISNMLESSIRAKVARTKSDMRVVSGAMESYHVDHNTYISFVGPPPGALFDRIRVPMTFRLSPLTTPVSYLTSVPVDVFETVATSDGSPLPFFDTYDYADVAGLEQVGSPKGAGATSGAMWRLSSAGPDRIQAYGGDTAVHGPVSTSNRMGVDYDPTNGSVSAGDIVAVGPPSEAGLPPAIRRTGGYQELFRDPPAPPR